MKKHFEFLHKIYSRLPGIVKRPISAILKPVYLRVTRILAIASSVRMPAYLIAGKERTSGEIIRALICAKNMGVAYLSGLIYSEQSSHRMLGNTFIWKAGSQIRKLQLEVDLVIVEFDKFYAKLCKHLRFLLVPKWVLFSLDISKPFPELMKSIKNKSLANNLSKLRRYNYSYEITRDLEKFALFYHHMYLPHTTKRFGKSSWIFSYNDLRRVLERGQLLLVNRDGAHLAGILLSESSESLLAHSLGVKDGNTEYVEQGALAASYFFTIIWAKEKGYQRIDFGYGRPFLRDGLFVHKKRWGMTIGSQNYPLGIFGVKVLHFSQSVRSFIAANPFIISDHGRLKGLLYSGQSQPLDAEDIRFMMRAHHINGLDGMIVVSPRGFTAEAQGVAEAEFPEKVRLSTLDVDGFFEQLSNHKN